MSLEGITKHPTLWFEDGNIVLVAEDTAFRVFKGVLARHSEVFRDAFQMPQPPAAGETLDGQPVVRLADDAAEEVAVILRILFDDGHGFYSDTVQISFEDTAAALRLGSKYSLEKIRGEAIRRISVCYPEHFEDFHPQKEYPDDLDTCPITWNKQDCIAVLHLARQFDLDDVVLSAMYKCVTSLSIEELFAAANSNERYHTLSQQELQDCILLYSDLQTEAITLYDTLCQASAPAGPLVGESGRCLSLRNAPFHPQQFRHIFENNAFDWIDHWVEGKCIHPDCAGGTKNLVAQLRDDIWSRLRRKYCPTHELEEASET